MQKFEYVNSTPLSPSVHRVSLDGSLRYSADAATQDEQITIYVEQSETCETTTTQRSHHRRTISRTADSKTLSLEWTTAAIGLSAGGYGYLNADGLASNLDSADPSYRTPQEYRQDALLLVGLGLAAGTLAVIDTIRASDEERDEGIVLGDVTRERATCRTKKTTNRRITLAVGTDSRIEGRLDETGRASFALTAVPESVLPEEEPHFEISLEGRRIAVDIDPEDWTQLRATLLADPASQLAIDVLARRRGRCTQLVEVARGNTRSQLDTDPEDVRRSWATAKTECDDLWTQDVEAEVKQVIERIEVRRCGIRLTNATAYLEGASDDEALSAIATELADIETTCKSPAHAEFAKQLESKIAVAAKRIAKARTDEEHRIAREEAQRRRQEQVQQHRAAQRARSWGDAMLRCNDGSLSPSCTCGRDSYRGCCSHHGGVDSCSVEQP